MMKHLTTWLTAAMLGLTVTVDTITGGIFAIPAEKISLEGGKLILKDILVYDAPTFITDRSLLPGQIVQGP